MNKRVLIGGLGIMTIGIILALVFLTGKGEPEVLRIGVIAPLSGTASYIGQEITNGVLLAEEEINANGDKVEIRFEDDRYDAKSTVSAFQDLINTYNPDVVISAGITEAIIPLAEDNEVPVLATVNSQGGLPKMGEYVFRFFTSADSDAPAMAKYASDNLRIRKAGVLYVNDGFGTSYYNVFKREIEKSGGEITDAEAITYTDWDYSTQLSKIKNSGAEAVYLIGIENQITNALRGMEKLGMLKDMKVLSAGTFATPNGVNETKNLNINVYTIAFCIDDLPGEYVKKYMDKYGNYPGFFSTFGYDSVKMIAESTKKGADRESVKKGLSNIKGFESIVGKVNVDSTGEMIFQVCAKKISKEGIYNFETGKYYNLG